ncbi:MAG: NAD-dependent epimerase/dehydratase family protein [Chloroflexi bacterium]|nr:NAD-dependent epimerase/dehydratase family protein [Chloroflexota bacterium]
MRIVVTGGSGRLGQHVIRELLEHGHDVLGLDRTPPAASGTALVVDVTRIGDLYQALQGADGVIHLAAYMAPGITSDSETFANNVTAAYNVLKAAFDLGVGHVVMASSAAAYGFIYAPRMWTPDYLPLDERHPCRPQDPYGLSKLVGEQIADSFAAQRSIGIVSLRLPGINFDLAYQTFPERWRDPGAPRALRGFWSYVDARDAARACRLAVEATLNGHHVLNAAAPDSSMPEPTSDLISRHLPDLQQVNGPPAARWSGLDSTRAAEALGWRAGHTWEQYARPRS